LIFLGEVRYTRVIMNYWLARGGQKLGPYSLEVLQRMAAEGNALASDLAWHEGMTAWAPLPQVVPMLAQQAAPPPPPPPAAGWPPPTAPNFGYPQGAVAVAPSSYLVPPDLHWALVFLFAYLTFGIFPIVWFFVQANFVRKLNPNDNSTLLGALGIGAPILGVLLIAASVAATDGNLGEGPQPLAVIGFLIAFLAGPILLLIGFFNMRSSLEDYYNRVEPIGLTLGGVMTFFFGLYYFQHHFSRIAQWKKTGYLRPQ
jgi:hypothetical protein